MLYAIRRVNLSGVTIYLLPACFGGHGGSWSSINMPTNAAKFGCPADAELRIMSLRELGDIPGMEVVLVCKGHEFEAPEFIPVNGQAI